MATLTHYASPPTPHHNHTMSFDIHEKLPCLRLTLHRYMKPPPDAQKWSIRPGTVPIFGTTRMKLTKMVLFSDEDEIIPEVKIACSNSEVEKVPIEVGHVEDVSEQDAELPQNAPSLLRRALSRPSFRKSKDEIIEKSLVPQIEKEPSHLKGALTGRPLQRIKRSSVPTEATQAEAGESHFLPHISTQYHLDAQMMSTCPDSERTGGRTVHILKPCAHAVHTHEPSCCGANCACSDDYDNENGEPIAVIIDKEDHPCPTCIDEALQCKHAKALKTLRLTTIKSFEIPAAGNATRESMSQARLAHKEFYKGEQNLRIIFDAGVRSEKRKQLSQKSNARAKKIGRSTIYTSNPPNYYGRIHKPTLSAKPRNNYRGVQRTDDLATLPEQGTVSRCVDAYEEARRRSPIDDTEDTQKNMLRRLIMRAEGTCLSHEVNGAEVKWNLWGHEVEVK